MSVSFSGLAIVAGVAFAAPLVLGLVPAVRLPAVVLEIVLGFLSSFALAVITGMVLDTSGLTNAPLLIAIMLSATSLGVVIPVLKDTGQASTRFGQLVLAGASIADVATVVLLSLFFSEKSSGLGAKLVLLGGFVALVAAIAVAVTGAERSMRLSGALLRLQDTSAQIRVRGAFLLL